VRRRGGVGSRALGRGSQPALSELFELARAPGPFGGPRAEEHVEAIRRALRRATLAGERNDHADCGAPRSRLETRSTRSRRRVALTRAADAVALDLGAIAATAMTLRRLALMSARDRRDDGGGTSTGFAAGRRWRWRRR